MILVKGHFFPFLEIDGPPWKQNMFDKQDASTYFYHRVYINIATAVKIPSFQDPFEWSTISNIGELNWKIHCDDHSSLSYRLLFEEQTFRDLFRILKSRPRRANTAVSPRSNMA